MDISDALTYINYAWQQVTSDTIRHSWNNLLENKVNTPTIEEEINEDVCHLSKLLPRAYKKKKESIIDKNKIVEWILVENKHLDKFLDFDQIVEAVNKKYSETPDMIEFMEDLAFDDSPVYEDLNHMLSTETAEESRSQIELINESFGDESFDSMDESGFFSSNSGSEVNNNATEELNNGLDYLSRLEKICAQNRIPCQELIAVRQKILEKMYL